VASSEDKRYRQSVNRHARNQAAKSRLKTLMKKVQAAIGSGDTSAAETQFRLTASALQKGGRKGIIHANTAARRVARLARAIHKSKLTSPSA
jgi:small subunit ribosomal protein S20